MPDFSDRAWQAGVSDDNVRDVIRLGRNLMPPFGDRIQAPGIDALVGHIRRLAAPVPTPAPTPEAAPADSDAG